MLFGGYTLEVPEAIPHVKWGLHLRPIREGNAVRMYGQANQGKGRVRLLPPERFLFQASSFPFHGLFPFLSSARGSSRRPFL